MSPSSELVPMSSSAARVSAAAGLVAAKKKKPPPAAAGPPPPPPPPPLPLIPPGPSAAADMSSRAAALQQHQLAEFNQWLYRWNNYQQHLAHYWQGRYHTLYQQQASKEGSGVGSKAVVASPSGKKKRAKKGESQLGVGVDKVEMKWQMRFQELCDFKEEHGHTDVPKEFTFKYSPPLGHWVGRMRYLHKKDKLEIHRIESLSKIGFKFILSKTGDVKFSMVWDKSFQALKAFKDSNGHLEVPHGYKPQPDMAELDGWITRQRKHFKDGKMPDHLKSKLMELGLNLGGRGRPYGLESEELWNSKYQDLVAYQQLNGDADVPEKYSKDLELGKWVKVQRDTYSEAMLPEDRITSLNSVGFNFYGKKTRRASKVVDPWERRLSELQAYKDKTGNTNVPKKFVLNFGLGDFVFNQRMAYKHKKLSEEKIKSLEDMKFDWTLKPKKSDKKKQTNWEKRFDELVAYKSKNGNLDIPNKYKANPLLSPWLKRQRKYHREGQMKPDKFEMLKDLGFNFGGPRQIKQPWTRQYESLVEFKNEHGHLDVPVHYEPNPPLYYWIGTQKQTHKKGKMPEDRIALLNEIDFDFSAKGRDRPARKGTRGGNKPFLDPKEWESLVGQLEKYKEKHNGDCDVPQRSGRLGSFVHYMRFYIKSGKLSQERIDRLNELGFSWNVTEDRWNAKYEAVAKYKTEVGNLDIPSQHSLYNWINYQRKLFLDNNLPQDRVETLENIGFDFQMPEPKRAKRKSDVKDPSRSWDSLFEDLMDFKDEHGNCAVPAIYDPNPSLAKWVASQRMKYKRGSLKDEHEDLLNDIGFKFGAKDPMEKLGVLKVPQVEPVSRESYLEDLWDKSYQELAAYSNHFGHCNIPISYDANPSLGAWAFSQRMAFKKNKLSEDRVEKLSKLGFSFGPKKTVEVTAEV